MLALKQVKQGAVREAISECSGRATGLSEGRQLSWDHQEAKR